MYKEVFKDRVVWRNEEDELHREDGPAIDRYDGWGQWYNNGELHRLNGPAIDYGPHAEWWVNDRRIIIY